MSLPVVAHRVRDGEARIRPAEASEKDRVRAFFESLDPETIYMRFLHPVKDFTRYVDMVFGPLNRYGVVAVAELGNSIIGLGELLAKDRAVGEVAVTVHPGYRRQGLGTKLTAYLAYAARLRGVERLEAYISSDNVAARRIAEKLGLRLEYTGMGVYRVLVDVAEASRVAARLLGLPEP